ncbi:hypothetical protein DFH06DRAFT_1005129 [Mycena polygramma]|nr:hypothetical protein DFH06DRAFT_1005129 [Mycena polygramma]
MATKWPPNSDIALKVQTRGGRVSSQAKTLESVKTFTKFNMTDSASTVHEFTLRREPALTQFETAQIANLCPATADEAKSVIPSLVKINDDRRLEALFRDIQTMRKYQS